jgi:hypothetical protein
MKKVLVSAVLISLLTSCATYKSGRTQQIRVNSTPQGATCNLSNNVSNVNVVTPAVAEVGRSMSTLKVTCQAQGFGNGDDKLKYNVNWWAAANIANFGIGYFYDVYTGSVAQYPSEINVTLKPSGRVYDGNFQMRDYNSNAVVPNAIPQDQGLAYQQLQQQQIQQQYQQAQQPQEGYGQPLQQQYAPQQGYGQPIAVQQPQQYQQQYQQPQQGYGMPQVQPQPQSQEQIMQQMMLERKQITGEEQQ